MNLDKIKGRMKEKRITQDKLAKKIGITIQSINAKLNGRREFKANEVSEIIKVLEIEEVKDFF